MLEREPSGTAIAAAMLRAAHQVLDDEPKILADPIAVGLVPGSTVEEIRANAAALEIPYRRAIRAILVMRSRYVEDVLRDVVAAGVRRYVMLGAGLDTFAYRQPSWASELELLEVDHPATQAWKRARLEERGIALPANLRYCPVDFEVTSLADGLARAGFDSRGAAYLSWLGVTQYLTEAAIDSTLRFVASLPRGSSIVFSYILADAALGVEDREFSATAAEVARSRGEPWLTSYAPGALRSRLARLGFAEVSELTGDAANARYFQHRGDGLRAPGYEQLVWAKV